MKHCLICFKDLYHKVSLYHYFAYDDIICEACRSKMISSNKWQNIKGLEVYSLYEYDPFMESLLFQFKEGRDIALKDVFFYKYRKYIEKVFKGYTLVYMPSSAFHTKQRGFFPLEEMLHNIKLPQCHYFEKNKEYKQSAQRYEDRKTVKDSITLKEGIQLADNIVLVDDVMTSGETLLSAYALIKNEGKNVKALVLCNNHRDVELCDEKKFPFFNILAILKKEVRTWIYGRQGDKGE